MIRFLFLLFRVTSLNLKNIKLFFELLIYSQPILKIQFFLCTVPFEGHQVKTSLCFWQPTRSCYPYIITSYCTHPLLSRLNLLVTRKAGTHNEIFYIFVKKTLAMKPVNGFSSKLVSQVRSCLLNKFQTWKCQCK